MKAGDYPGWEALNPAAAFSVPRLGRTLSTALRSEFRFLYLARVDSHFEKAKELFDSLVAIPLGSDVSADLLRYFQIRKASDLSRYTSLTEADLIFRNQAKPDSPGSASSTSIADGKSDE